MIIMKKLFKSIEIQHWLTICQMNMLIMMNKLMNIYINIDALFIWQIVIQCWNSIIFLMMISFYVFTLSNWNFSKLLALQ